MNMPADLTLRMNRTIAPFRKTVTLMAAAAAAELLDNFTGTDGDSFAAHTSDSGHTWSGFPPGGGSIGSGDLSSKQIASNRLISTNGDYGLGLASWAPASPDYYIEAKVRFHDVGDLYFQVLLGARLIDDGFGFALGYVLQFGYDDGYGWRLIIWRVNGGATVVSAALGTINFDQDYVIKFTLSGTTLKGYVDGVETISGTDGDFTAAGSVGLLIWTPQPMVDYIKAGAL